MFETFNNNEEFVKFLASINIYKIDLPEALEDMFEADTGKGILISEQVNKEVNFYGICKCGTLQLFKGLSNNNCPLCFTPYSPIKKGLNNKEFVFKYKKTKTFNVDEKNVSIIVKEGTPIFQLVKEKNQYKLNLIEVEKSKTKEIKLSTDGSHLKDFSIYRFLKTLNDKHVISFVKKMNEIVDKKYHIEVNKSMINHMSDIRIIVVKQMYFETIRTLQQYLKTTIPNSFFVEDSTLTTGREDYLTRIENGAISLNKNEINPDKRKIHQILKLPKVLIDEFLNSIRLKDFYYEFGKFKKVQNFYETISNKNIELTQKFIQYKMHNSTNAEKIIDEIKVKYNHDIKALMKYIIKTHTEEKLDIYNVIVTYRDYLSMCSQMNLKPIKYPKNLMLVHDIMVKDFKIIANKESMNSFKKTYKELNDNYSYMDSNHVYLQPLSIQALVEEGNLLHHCISSYANKVIENNSLIYFMRKSYEPEVPYITVEIIDKTIVEARGSFNRRINKEEYKHIKRWAKLKSLAINESI